MKPVIFGLSGLTLSDDERAFFADCDPAGYILFKRNIADRAQLRALTDDLRALSGRDNVPILIDQEGGRVARMGAPEWPVFPAAGRFEPLYQTAPMSAIEAVRANMEALAITLAEVGITVDCAPVLDVRTPETHDAIGDRSFGHDPMHVAAMGRAALDGLRAGGVVGIIKHMPGQGRARVDSHHDLPVIDASVDELAVDLAPFKALSDAPMAMTGHIVFTAWDAERCATMSPALIDTIIRGEIGFDGLLFSDDLDMKALDGNVAERALRCVQAGCDIALNCWARMDEMVAIAAMLPDISAKSRDRLDRAMAGIAPRPDPARARDLIAKRDELLALA